MTSSSLRKSRLTRFIRPASRSVKHGSRYRPRLESLEDRTVPAISTAFEIDGNALESAATPGDDWDNVVYPVINGGAIATTVDEGDGDGVLDDPKGTTIFTTGGSKDDLDISNWRHSSGSVPDKDEITNAYAAAYSVDTDTNGSEELLLYFGADRFATNGSAQIGFWFFQNTVSLNPNGTFNGVHKDGDILILSNFVNGGGVPVIQVFRWNGPGGSIPGSGSINGTIDPLAAPSLTEAVTNSATTDAPWDYLAKNGSIDFPAGAFFEGGINLTKIFALVGQSPGCFASFLAETRSSPSIDATLKDFVLGTFDLCSIDVTKTGDTIGKVTDPVDYTITVKNDGALPLFPVSVTDVGEGWAGLGDLLDDTNPYVVSIDDGVGGPGLEDNVLEVNEVWTITASYVVQPGDPDPLRNTVTAVFSHDEGEPVEDSVSDSASHEVNLFQPSIELTKSANRTMAVPGDTVTYTITVENTSSDDSPNLVGTLTDPLLGFSTPINLAPGESVSFDVPYLVPEDADDPLTNTAWVNTSPVGFPNPIDDAASFVLDLFQPAIQVVKGGDTLGKIHEGQPHPVDYTFTITNLTDGDLETPALDGVALKLLNINLTDSLLGALVVNGVAAPGVTVTGDTGNDGKMGVGEAWVVTTQRVPQPGDPDQLKNTAEVTAETETVDGLVYDVSDVSNEHTVDLFTPHLTITKTALDDDGEVGIGEIVTYEITLTNDSDGDLDTPGQPDGFAPALTAISIFDEQMKVIDGVLQPVGPHLGDLLDPFGFTDPNGNGKLDHGETWVGQFAYEVQPEDFPDLIDRVTAVFEVDGVPGTGFEGGNTLTETALEDLLVTVPELVITKTVPGGGTVTTITEGEDAVFTITVDNVGNGAATGVVLTDTLTDGGVGLDWEVIFTSDPTVTVTLPDPPAVQLLTANIGTLGAGESYTIIVSADTTGIFDEDTPPGGTGNLPDGPFELDGNALDGPAVGDDWSNAVFGDGGSSTAHSIVADAFNSQQDDIFTGGGSKDTLGIQDGPWLFTPSKPQAKNDITNAYAAMYTDPVNEHVILYVGLDRFDNSGDATVGFWFFQNPIEKSTDVSGNGTGPFIGEHADGDILLVSDFSNGGGTSTILVFRWEGDDATGQLELVTTLPGTTFARVNTGSIDVPWDFEDKSHNTDPATGEFFEGGVDLTALGLGSCFANFLAETRSSTSPTATLSDFVIGNFDTCRLDIPNVATVDSDQTEPQDSEQALIIVVGDSDSHSHGEAHGAAAVTGETGSDGGAGVSPKLAGGSAAVGGDLSDKTSGPFGSIWLDLGSTALSWNPAAGAVTDQDVADEELEPALADVQGQATKPEQVVSDAGRTAGVPGYADLADDSLAVMLGISVDPLPGVSV